MLARLIPAVSKKRSRGLGTVVGRRPTVDHYSPQETLRRWVHKYQRFQLLCLCTAAAGAHVALTADRLSVNPGLAELTNMGRNLETNLTKPVVLHLLRVV